MESCHVSDYTEDNIAQSKNWPTLSFWELHPNNNKNNTWYIYQNMSSDLRRDGKLGEIEKPASKVSQTVD